MIRTLTLFGRRYMRVWIPKDLLRCDYIPTKLEKLLVRGDCSKGRRPFPPSAMSASSSGVFRDFEASSSSLADSRSFLAVSAGPKILDRSFDLFALFRLDLRPLAMPLECVYLRIGMALCFLCEVTLLNGCDEEME